MPFHLDQCLERLASRNPGRTEADIQADVRDVLLYGGFELGDENVRLESPAPDQRRIDVEVGALVVECKRDLRPSRILENAEVQLGGYLADRQSANHSSYVGVLTDGITWRCYRTIEQGVQVVSVLELRPGQIDERRFRWWIGSLLATERLIAPTAVTIEERLGSESPGCKLATMELADLLTSATESPEVKLKRALWAKLLRTALGTQFEDNDALFVEHTYLVLVATLIAHIVIGFDPVELGQAPATTLSGQLFAKSGIRGVGEAGFFDWVLDVPEGERIVADLARRLSVFEWVGVDHDVLKALYQSVIEPETRHRLGEYYTPDWLAYRIIEQVVTEPLTSRVLDPACGSGTFLFHAVRKFLEAAEFEGQPLKKAVGEVGEHVFGMDLHPVAVVLAQVTYLLAIGANRTIEAGVPISIPVYLGDSMRWEVAEETVLAQSGEIVVPTGLGHTLFGSEELRFPASVVADPSRFDRLVDEMATRAASRNRGDKPLPIGGVLSNFGVNEVDRPVLEATYQHFCELHDQERDHIWGFFVRNQARPTWFASPANRVDVLVGNPPWLSYRFMPKELQDVFQRRAKERKLWAGGARGRTTQQDLSAFFVVRSIELYLRVGGRFGFVMPLAALSRQTYGGFRAGNFSSKTETIEVAFGTPWDLDAVEPDPFPVPSSVVLGERVTSLKTSELVPLPTKRLAADGHVDGHGGSDGANSLVWRIVEPHGDEETYTKANSPYAKRFRQGAILVPRMLVFVEEEPPGPLQPSTHVAVRSRRGRLDKKPWRTLPDLTGTVEKIFLRSAYLGEHCLPFRMLSPGKVVIPFDGPTKMSGDDERIDRYPGLADWWRRAERVWIENRSSEKRTLLDQIDYIKQLSAQFPTSHIRVVYTKAGNYLTSAIVTDGQAVIDHKLYWGATASMEEAYYLTAVLNAPAIAEIVAPYQSRGAFGARDFDKYVWYPPIPDFDGTIDSHGRLAELGARATQIATAIEIPDGVGFQRARSLLRAVLRDQGLFNAIDDEVHSILSNAERT
jgi:SAM-dependent methyltransferase